MNGYTLAKPKYKASMIHLLSDKNAQGRGRNKVVVDKHSVNMMEGTYAYNPDYWIASNVHPLPHVKALFLKFRDIIRFICPLGPYCRTNTWKEECILTEQLPSKHFKKYLV